MTIKSLRGRLNGLSTAHVVNSNDYKDITKCTCDKCKTSNVNCKLNDIVHKKNNNH